MSNEINSGKQEIKSKEGEPMLYIAQDTLIKVLKGVSLYDLSECAFECGAEDGEQYVNAVAKMGGRVYDAITWDGNIFKMMNNDGSFAPLNPMIRGYELASQFTPIASTEVVSKQEYDDAINEIGQLREQLKDVEGMLREAYREIQSNR